LICLRFWKSGFTVSIATQSATMRRNGGEPRYGERSPSLQRGTGAA
jgi:hypothetical protein